MKVLKALAIAYLVWAIGYTLVVLPPWVRDAVAFKLSGGPEVILVFEKTGFRVGSDVQGAADNGNLALSMSYKTYPYLLRYFWGSSIETSLRKNLESGEEPFSSSSWKRGMHWAVLVAPLRHSTIPGQKERPDIVKRALQALQINLGTIKWVPLSESRFLIDSIPIFDPANSSLFHFPPVGFPVLLLIMAAYPIYYPVAAFYAALIAFSPPAIVGYTIYLPFTLPILYFLSRVVRRPRELK